MFKKLKSRLEKGQNNTPDNVSTGDNQQKMHASDKETRCNCANRWRDTFSRVGS